MKKTEENNNNILPDEDIFADIDGLPEETTTYHIYRQGEDKKETFLNTVFAPFSINDIKNEHGGGNYMIYVKDKNKIVKKKKILIAGKSKLIDEVADGKAIDLSPRNNINDFIEAFKVFSEITKKDDNSGSQMQALMSGMTATMIQVQKSILDMTRANIDITKDIQEMKSSDNVLDVVNNGIEQAGNIFNAYLARQGNNGNGKIKNKKEISANKPKQKNNQPSISFIQILNDAQIRKHEIDFIIDLIETYFPNIKDYSKNLTFEQVLPELQKIGLKITDKNYLEKLYKEMKEEIKL